MFPDSERSIGIIEELARDNLMKWWELVYLQSRRHHGLTVAAPESGSRLNI